MRKALRQAWEIDDAEKAKRLLRNLAQQLEGEASGVAKSILEGPSRSPFTDGCTFVVSTNCTGL